MQKIYADNIRMKSRPQDSAECLRYFKELNQLLTLQPDSYAKMDRLKGYYYQRMGDTVKAKHYYRQFWRNATKDSCSNALLLNEVSYSLFIFYDAMARYDSALYFIKQTIVSVTQYKGQGQDVALSFLLSPAFYEKYKNIYLSLSASS
ncbi:MAG: hypothetical protein HC817_13115, partial [Saprospiraceae bacterium]|nr:hypothetical protein [Saprospiraceae bacterium]